MFWRIFEVDVWRQKSNINSHKKNRSSCLFLFSDASVDLQKADLEGNKPSFNEKTLNRFFLVILKHQKNYIERNIPSFHFFQIVIYCIYLLYLFIVAI